MFEVLHQNYHMQGFTTDGEYMYWSFTDSLVKTNKNNTVIAQVPVLGGHLGDVDCHNGKIYGTLMGNSLRGEPWGKWTGFFVYVFDAGTLALEKMIRLDPCYEMHAKFEEYNGFRGIDGISVIDGCDGNPELWVAGSLEVGESFDKQQIFHFSFEGELLETKRFYTKNTTFGIQNFDYEPDTGLFWFTTYSKGQPFQADYTLYAADPQSEKLVYSCDVKTPYGFHAFGDKKYLISYECGVNGNREGYAEEVTLDDLLKGGNIIAQTKRKA